MTRFSRTHASLPKCVPGLILALCCCARSDADPTQRVRAELRRTYEAIEVAYKMKKPAAILAFWASDYRGVTLVFDDNLGREVGKPIARKQAEAELRAMFPGNRYAPRNRYTLQKLKVLHPGQMVETVVSDYRVVADDPTDTSRHPSGNARATYIWRDTWIRTSHGWRLKSEDLLDAHYK